MRAIDSVGCAVRTNPALSGAHIAPYCVSLARLSAFQSITTLSWHRQRPAPHYPDYTPEMPDDEILRRLLALNLERAACPAAA